MHTRIKAEIVALAKATPTEEVCGFVYAGQDGARLYPCRNVAANREEEFAIDSSDQVEAIRRGELLGVYHSHPDDSAFSPADLDYAVEMALPQFLYAVGSDRWYDHTPSTYRPPLEGRQWVLGFHDCYSIPRDYWCLRGHGLSDYDRDESFCHEEQGVIMANFEREGFMQIALNELREHDIMLFHTDKALPQHFGVYLGGNSFLHHPQRALSGREQLNDRWIKRLVCAFRRKPDPIPV